MTQETSPPNNDLNTVDMSSVMRCYALLGFGMLFGLAPVPILSSVASLALIVGTIWAYRIRKKPSLENIYNNHGRWMTRTFWIASFYLIVAVILSASIISSNADSTAIFGMSEGLSDGSLAPTEVSARIEEYMSVNRTLMTVTSIICFGPILFFAIARFFIGYRLADAGKPVTHLKTWLIR